MDTTAPPVTKDEEGEEPVVAHPFHDYDKAQYKKVVGLIEKYQAQYGRVRQLIRSTKNELEEAAEALDHLAGRVVREADRSQPRLNLMNDSVLHEVINRGNTDLALRIIGLPEVTRRGMLDHQNNYGDTPLHIAAKKGDSKVAKALLPSKDYKKLAEKRNRKGETPLHKAVLYGHLDVFNSIIEVVGDEMATDRTGDGSTILHYAIMSDQPKEALEIARRFPEMIFSRNDAGATPLQIMAAFFKKPYQTGFFESLLYKQFTWVKATTMKAWKKDEESGRIENANAGKWRSRLPGWLGKSQLVKNIEKLLKRIVTAGEEKSKYEMTMKLLKFLAQPSKDDLQKESFDFYFGGFTSIGSHNVPKIAAAAGDDESPAPVPTAEIKTTPDVSSGTSDLAAGAGSAIDGKEKTMLHRHADELVSSIMSWGGGDNRAGRNAAMGELVKRAKRALEEVSAEKDRKIWEESPLITGVKLGLEDFVIKILKVCPQSATYVGYDGMNVLQAAVKYDRRQVVDAIKEDERLPAWLFTELESETKNNLLHIAASDKTVRKEADPLRLQDELEWFEMLEKVVPKELLNYRNKAEKTAREVFDEKHEGTAKVCRAELAEIGRTCSPLLAAVVFTSSFYIPDQSNRQSGGLAFKIFSHVYVAGFSCSATSLIMFLLLVVTPFRQSDFRRTVPWHYLMACFLLAMSLAAFIVAFACNMYMQIYGDKKKSHADLAILLLELFLVPFLCTLALSLSGASWRFGSLLERLTK